MKSEKDISKSGFGRKVLGCRFVSGLRTVSETLKHGSFSAISYSKPSGRREPIQPGSSPVDGIECSTDSTLFLRMNFNG